MRSAEITRKTAETDITISLDLDGTPANTISTGPLSPNLAWDQCARHLPTAISVRPGDELTLVARHTDCYLQTLRLSGFTADMLAKQGTPLGGQAKLVGNARVQGLSVVLDAPVGARRG